MLTLYMDAYDPARSSMEIVLRGAGAKQNMALGKGSMKGKDMRLRGVLTSLPLKRHDKGQVLILTMCKALELMTLGMQYTTDMIYTVL